MIVSPHPLNVDISVVRLQMNVACNSCIILISLILHSSYAGAQYIREHSMEIFDFKFSF